VAPEERDEGPSWLNITSVDEMGLYQTERDKATEGITAKSRRHFNMDKPAPFLYGSLQPRDTYGTPAPHLAPPELIEAAEMARTTQTSRRGSLVQLQTNITAKLENKLWNSAHHGTGHVDVETMQKGKHSNAVLRRVMDKLYAKSSDPRVIWARMNNNHDYKCDVREMREGMARCVNVNACMCGLFLIQH
jgi:hypothetical protein